RLSRIFAIDRSGLAVELQSAAAWRLGLKRERNFRVIADVAGLKLHVSVFARLRRRRCRHQQAAIADAQSPDRKILRAGAPSLCQLSWARRLAVSATSRRFSRGGSPQAGKIPFAACAADQPYL